MGRRSISSVNGVDSLSWGVLVGLRSVTKTSASSSRMQRVSRTWLSSELRGHRKGAAQLIMSVSGGERSRGSKKGFVKAKAIRRTDRMSTRGRDESSVQGLEPSRAMMSIRQRTPNKSNQ